MPSIIQMQNGALLVTYNSRPAGNSPMQHFAIRTKISADGGLSWRQDRLVYAAGTTIEAGCWEPAPLQLPSGEIQLFFSNEAPYTKSDEQNISMLRSLDNGLSWTTQPQVISFRKGKRDGMPVPILSIDKKQIIFSIEDNATGEFKPAIISNSVANNWRKLIDGQSMQRRPALAVPLADSIYAGAPFLARLKNGSTVLSYQTTEGRKRQWNLAAMQVVVGDSRGLNCANATTPFKIPTEKFALWNSIAVLEDDTIIALTSTNAYSQTGATEIWMIKGQLQKSKD